MEYIPVASPVFNGNEKKYLNECIDTGWISANGSFVTQLEEKFAAYCGVQYALACCNGTMTLHLSLLALDIQPGDEVIMPALTYIATANAVRYCGAVPVFVDSDPLSWNMDVSKIEEKVTSKTKAIMPVHLYGLPADMDEINAIAQKHGLTVIEDAAEANGAVYRGEKTGALGDIGSFSLFGNKIITAGEGGLITTDNEEHYKKMKLLRGQGMNPQRRYWHDIVGYNYRITNMQAAVALAQLENIEWHFQRRQDVKKMYDYHMTDIRELVELQASYDDRTHSYWMYSIILNDRVNLERDEVMAKLAEKNIETRPLFYPLHVMPPYKDASLSLPIAERLSARGINLPTYAMLSEEQVAYIIRCLVTILTA